MPVLRVRTGIATKDGTYRVVVRIDHDIPGIPTPDISIGEVPFHTEAACEKEADRVATAVRRALDEQGAEYFDTLRSSDG